jgi:uncharacterized coiled-coil protein SlyX
MTNERVQQDEFNQSRPKTIVARLTEQLAAQDREIERLRAALEHIATRNFIGAQCRRFARETLGMPPDEPEAPSPSI